MPNKKGGRPKVVYHTPGRECAHADKGCCPKCLDPMEFVTPARRRRFAVNKVSRSSVRT